MSNIVVLVFDNMEEAEKVRETMKSVEEMGKLSLDDSAVVVKDEDGKIQVKNEMDRGVKVGAIGGGLLGLLIGGVFFPVAGLLIGVLGGIAIGKLAGMNVDKDFLKEVEDALQPGTSAIFLISRDADPTVALAALRPYTGKIYYSTLDPELETELRHILSQKM